MPIEQQLRLPLEVELSPHEIVSQRAYQLLTRFGGPEINSLLAEHGVESLQYTATPRIRIVQHPEPEEEERTIRLQENIWTGSKELIVEYPDPNKPSYEWRREAIYFFDPQAYEFGEQMERAKAVNRTNLLFVPKYLDAMENVLSESQLGTESSSETQGTPQSQSGGIRSFFRRLRS